MHKNYEDWTISSEASIIILERLTTIEKHLIIDEPSRVGEIRNGRLSYNMIEDIV